MPIPRTRRDLIDLVRTSHDKLAAELDDAATETVCTEEGWTVRDLLAVRVRWTAMVLGWIRAGRDGETPVTPAPGYGWKETPRLNQDIVDAAGGESFDQLTRALRRGVDEVLATIDELSDEELLEAGVFEWAGKWPIARWISINTSTQYASARTLIRKARR